MSTELVIAKDRDEHASLAAELMARAIHEAVTDRGVARVALSGGSTPSDAYRRVAALDLPFERVRWFWVDERAVEPSNPRSNFGAAMKDFGLASAEGDTKLGRFFRMPGEAPDLANAALAYEKLVRSEFGVASAAAFDVMILGVGDDGHTASLFPGLGVVGIDDRLVAAIPEQPAKKLEARLTLTAPVIRESRLIVVLARGADKRPVIEKARAAGPEEEIPSRLIQRARGRVVWLVDHAAAPA